MFLDWWFGQVNICNPRRRCWGPLHQRGHSCTVIMYMYWIATLHGGGILILPTNWSWVTGSVNQIALSVCLHGDWHSLWHCSCAYQLVYTNVLVYQLVYQIVYYQLVYQLVHHLLDYLLWAGLAGLLIDVVCTAADCMFSLSLVWVSIFFAIYCYDCACDWAGVGKWLVGVLVRFYCMQIVGSMISFNVACTQGIQWICHSTDLLATIAE